MGRGTKLTGRTLFALLVAAAPGAMAQETAQEMARLVAKSVPKPVDRLMTASDVSVSRPIVGVMFVASEPSPQPGLAVRVPQDWAGASLCVRLLSADGLYEGSAEYDVTEASLGRLATLELAISPAHVRRLVALGGDDLGVAVTRGGCAEAGAEHLPAFWRGAPGPAAEQAQEQDEVRLLVNSQGAEEVALVVRRSEAPRAAAEGASAGAADDATGGASGAAASGGASAQEVSCRPIPARAGVAFDYVCAIDAAALAPAATVQLVRMTMGAYEEPVEIRVTVPAVAQ